MLNLKIKNLAASGLLIATKIFFLYFAAISGEFDPEIPTFGTGSVRLNNFNASSTFKIIVSLIKFQPNLQASWLLMT